MKLKYPIKRYLMWVVCLCIGHRHSVIDKLHCTTTTLGCRRCTFEEEIPVDWHQVGRISTRVVISSPNVLMKVFEDDEHIYDIVYTKKEAIQQGRILMDAASKLKRVKAQHPASRVN